MSEKAERAFASLCGPAVALVSIVLYTFTLSAGAYPGNSASLVVQRLGLMPEMLPTHPVWRMLGWPVLRIPIGDPVQRLNFLSAIFGGLSVWLLYRVVVDAVRRCVLEADADELRARIAAQLAGCAAALALAFCTPFWVASTRACPATLDVCLLLLSVWLLFRYSRTGAARLPTLLGFLFGVGVAEYATFIMFAPLFGGCLLFFMWQKGELRGGPILRLILAALAGLSLYFLAAWRFYGSAAYRWREYSGYWQIIWYVWRDQYLLITRSLPQRGWLLVLILTVAPWLTALGVARRALNGEKDWTYYLLHGVMTAMAVGVLLNLKLAPWPMLGESHLLVMPYILTASLAGYLVAYWFLLPAVFGERVSEQAQEWLRKWLGWILIVPLVTVLLVAAFRNLREADGRPAAAIRGYAKDVIAAMGTRSWLITDGSLDSHLLIAAHEAGSAIHVANLYAGNNPVYLKSLASQLEGARLKNLAMVGILPMFKGLLEAQAGGEQKLAVMSVPDLWTAAGCQMVPHQMLFFGTRNPESLKPDELMTIHERFWAERVPPLRQLAGGSPQLRMLAKHILRSVGLVANDLGVLMEDLGRKDHAFKAYKAAREIDPQNVSALLNMDLMIEKGWKTEKSEEIRKEVEALGSGPGAGAPRWSLSWYYGYVRTPEAFARRGWTWALSGQAGLAVSELEKAMDLSTDETRDVVKQMLAGAYLAEEQPAQGEELYRDLLARNPTNFSAAVGLSRISARKGDFAKARDWLHKAEAAGAPARLIGTEGAALLQAEGRSAEARAALEKIVEANPGDLRAWVLLADVLIQVCDAAALDKCIARMARLRGSEGYVAAARASLAAAQNDWEAAWDYLKQAVAAMPGNLQLLERQLTLDLMLRKADDVEADARRLLRAAPDSAIGNYVMGTLHIRYGDYDLAEDSFRNSLGQKKTVGALNDLAWLLAQKGKYAEAEKLVREALQMDKKAGAAWDTLGVILMATERLADAEQAIERSLSISQADLSVFLHLAELQVRKGDAKRAREIIDMLYGKSSRLSPRDQVNLNALSRQTDELAARAEADR